MFIFQMNASDPCIPWYFPKSEANKTRICDPWEAREFRKEMSLVPIGTCDGCLPNCNTTLYSASATVAPIRRCDYKNLGLSFLCNFEEDHQPPIWADSVLEQYMTEIQQVPEYLKSLEGRSNKRFFADKRAPGKPIFMAVNQETYQNGSKFNKSYNAYEKDIAVATFFFESNTAFEFGREQKMTLTGYISQMGGLLGLFMGFSFISAIEILYWFSIRLTRNINHFQN